MARLPLSVVYVQLKSFLEANFISLSYYAYRLSLWLMAYMAYGLTLPTPGMAFGICYLPIIYIYAGTRWMLWLSALGYSSSAGHCAAVCI